MPYAKALKKLEALPPGERQLAAGQYVWEVKKGKSHCGCAIGKLLTEKQRVRLFKMGVNAGGVDDLRISFFKSRVPEEGWIGHNDPSGILDLTYGEANALQHENDGFRGSGFIIDGTGGLRNSYANRKARYKHVVAWLKEQIAAHDKAERIEF